MNAGRVLDCRHGVSTGRGTGVLVVAVGVEGHADIRCRIELPVLNTPCRAYRSWEATKEQTADLYHRILTSAGYSASSLEKYHYLSDCHRHVRSNLTLIPGVLAVLHPQKLWRTR